MKTLYLDATAGIAGDMVVATLLDLGVPLEELKGGLALLDLPEGSYSISAGRVERCGFSGIHFLVELPGDNHHHPYHHHRSYADIKRLIADSRLAGRVKGTAQQIFKRLAEAEAEAHQVPVEQVHFHEVGAVDSIVDIVGTAICLHRLGVEQIYCSPVPLGGGFVESSHGMLPVPAPATALLMKGLLVHGNCGNGERVTPTGAAILAALARPVSTMPVMQITATGSGAGSMDFEDRPNLLRSFLGEQPDCSQDNVVELACNLDDVTPEVIGYTVQRLFNAGALDVWTVPIQMKKQRPGVLLALLCKVEQSSECIDILMQETGTLGVRMQQVQRLLQRREVTERQTSWGTVRYKQSDCCIKPEFDDCMKIAERYNLPVRQVQKKLMELFYEE